MDGRIAHGAAALAALGLFALPLALVGSPLVFFGDTATYFAQLFQMRDWLAGGGGDWPDQQLSLGRSVFYSAFLGVGHALSPVWGAVGLQIGLTLAATAWLGARLAALDAADCGADGGTAAAGRRRGALLLCLAAGASSAPWFAGLLMPDAFSALGILAAAALIALHDRLGAVARAGLAALALVAAVMHDTHLLVLAAMTAAAILVPGLAAPGPPGDGGRAVRRLRLTLAAICAAGFGLSALNAPLLERVSGQPPARMPFLSAHLIDMGPGRELLEERCPEAGFALCRFEIAPEATWEEILFVYAPGRGVYNLADPETRLALGEEQVRFALATLAFAPAATISGLAADGAAQLTRVSLMSLDPALSDWDRYLRRLPPPLRARVGDGRLGGDPDRARALLATASAWIAAVAVAATAALAVAALRLGPRPALRADPAARRRLRLAGALTAGVVLNGLACGAIASPYDRFQSRVIWLIPVAAVALAPAALSGPRARRASRPARPPSPSGPRPGPRSASASLPEGS